MKKNILLTLVSGIGALSTIKILSRTKLYFTDAQAKECIKYLFERNGFLGVSNLFMWIVIIAALVMTYLNMLSKSKKEC